jgi:hypothetical protein
MEGMMDRWFGVVVGEPEAAEAPPAQQNPVVGVWRGSLLVFGSPWNDEYVFQPTGAFSQQSNWNGQMLHRTGLYSIMPSPQPGTGVIQLNTLQASNGVLLQDGLNFYCTDTNTLMLQPLSTGIWTQFQRGI